jgi:hypothetical protein
MKAKEKEQYYKFFNLAGIPPALLKNEEHANLYLTPKKESKSERPRVLVWLKNAIDQADLCEMPEDKGYNYFLAVVELACRRVDGQPIKDKEAPTVLEAFKKIFGRGRIIPPTHKLEVDSGLEFNNRLIRNFFTKVIGVLVRYSEPGRHTQQCFVEKVIQEIQKPLLKRMVAQEMLTGQKSVEWVDDFHRIVDEVDKKWQRDPPELCLDPPKLSDKDELLSEGTRVRVKLGDPISVLGKKLHGRFRTGDIRWHPEIRIIKKLTLSPGQPPMYLLNGPHGRLGVSRCAYTRKQLQVVPDNENAPPDSVIRGDPKYYVPERILKQRTRNGKLEYLIKWRRYPMGQSTWEPAERIKEDAPKLISIFNGT